MIWCLESYKWCAIRDGSDFQNVYTADVLTRGLSSSLHFSFFYIHAHIDILWLSSSKNDRTSGDIVLLHLTMWLFMMKAMTISCKIPAQWFRVCHGYSKLCIKQICFWVANQLIQAECGLDGRAVILLLEVSWCDPRPLSQHVKVSLSNQVSCVDHRCGQECKKIKIHFTSLSWFFF